MIEIYKKKEEKNISNKQRNHYIDVLKGIAIISVVFIHTAFHSGSFYVPRWFANFTLLFEVSLFFFLAGWSFSYSKSNKSYIKSLITTQIRYMLYISLVFIIINILNYVHFSNNNITIGTLIKWFFHEYSSTTPLNSVNDSLWFFKVYFIVSIIASTLIKLVNKKYIKIVLLICILFVFVITFYYPSLGNVNLGIEASYLFFYLFFYLLGNISKDIKIKLPEFLLYVVLLMFILFFINTFSKINILDLQTNKFPPNFIFLVWSLFGVVFVIYLKNFFGTCKENILSKVGQNSIYVYFAQGIAASCLYYISTYIFTNGWYYKLILMFGINLILTGVITIILKLIIEPLVKLLKRFLEKNVYN